MDFMEPVNASGLITRVDPITSTSEPAEKFVDYLNISGIFDYSSLMLNYSSYRMDAYHSNFSQEIIIYGLILSDITRKIGLWMNPILIVVGLLANMLVILVFTRAELRKLCFSIDTVALCVSEVFLMMIGILVVCVGD